MSFSNEWDELYRVNQHMSIWPWSDLVSFVKRHAKTEDGFLRVLELGCGAGANIPFFLHQGSDYHAIEGSATIVRGLLNRYPELSGKIIVEDFTRSISFPGFFDLVVDRSSSTCNNTEGITRTLELVYNSLRSGGKFIGIDWFSDQHMDSKNGDFVDTHTRKNLPYNSHLVGTGNVHFCDEGHLVSLLQNSGFMVDRLEHKTNRVFLPICVGQYAWWNFVATKP